MLNTWGCIVMGAAFIGGSVEDEWEDTGLERIQGQTGAGLADVAHVGEGSVDT